MTHAVPRGALLAGWFAGTAAVASLGLAASALLGWLAVAGASVALQPQAYVALLVGVAGTTLAAIALRLAVGAAVSAVPAALTCVGICAVVAVGAWSLPVDPSLVPGGAHAALSRLTEPGSAAAGPGLRAAGVGLATTGALLVVARLALRRAEL